MNKADAVEAAPILQRSVQALLGVVASDGTINTSNLRTACGALIANAEALIQADAVGPPLIECLNLAIMAGATQPQLDVVRAQAQGEAPVSLGATMIRDSIVELCYAAEGQVIAAMVFTSRQDVEALLASLNGIFQEIEEMAADAMDQMVFQALVQLQSALVFHLTSTARPLPRMVGYAFSKVMPSLEMAQRLYYDATRADQLRDENKVVHPAFMPPVGRALSF